MSAGRASQLEDESRNVVPGLFQALVSHGRPVLLEVACDSDSILTTTIQEQVGCTGAAHRASLWNGADLGTSAGVKLILERIATERPGTVWLSPPCGPFSPLQHTNARSAEQREELKRKREVAKRVYAGAAIVYRYCMQQGIHCAWEMSEKSDAWRLPVLQELHRKFQPHVAVCQGCRVELWDSGAKRLLKKGWKIITSHAKLAQELHLPCKCHRTYQHGRCEGEAASRSARYTSLFARRVAQALLFELNAQDVIHECSGRSKLPENFGEGLTCQCSDLPSDRPDQCGACLVGKLLVQNSEASGTSGNPKPQAVQEVVTQDLEPETLRDEIYQAEEVQHAERLAQSLLQQKDFSHEACHRLLQTLPLKAHTTRPGKLQEPKASYFAFGAYSYGSQYGVTGRTQKFPRSIMYINKFIRTLCQKPRRWTSVVLNYNHKMPLHKDVNNEARQPNLVVGLGDYEQGGLWVQETGQAKEMGLQNGQQSVLCARTTPTGEQVWGRVYETRKTLVELPPKAWHGTEPWTGWRVTISAYTNRGFCHLTQNELQQLRDTGFPLPPRPHKLAHEVHALDERKKSTQKEEERLKRQLYLLHAATGHCSTQHLLDALKRRHAKPEVLKLAAEFKCSICEERKKIMPRHVASLEPLPPKFHTITTDIGHFRHPHTGEHHQFMLIIDEGSRFRIARILSTGAKQQPSGAKCIEYLREGWAQIFGNPRTLRLDPAGNFRSTAVSDYCHRHDIYLDLVPGEAHWKIGVCEQAIQGIKTVMTKICASESTVSAEEALSTAIRTFNQRDLVRGFSPVQHVLGQVPDETGRIDVATPAIPPELLVENPTVEFQQSVQRRTEAEKAHAEWNAQQRLNRAANSRTRPVMDYQPGELVFYWRQQDSAKNRQGPSSKRGYFMGPARVLATETRRNPDGTLQPGSTVWCVRGRQLIKCCVEQLRRASHREELIESVADQDATPWSFTRVSEQIGGNQYEDVSGQVPSDMEWWRSQDPEEEQQPTRHRVRGKRPAPPVITEDSDEELLPDRDPTPSESSRQRVRRQHQDSGECWWTQVKEDDWSSQDQAFWQDSKASVEIDVELPRSSREWDRALGDFGYYVVGALKRRAVEVRERHLSEEERLQFVAAKAAEVKNFIASEAFESLPSHLKPSREQAIGMRWILTWKYREDGSKKAKARAVLLGYQDPSYEHRSTTAPVMSRQSRQMLLQQAANRQWTVFKGDVSGAFLQGRQYPDTLHCVPCDEICDAMQIPRGSITRLKRACYGLVDAPLEWYRSVSEFLEGLGLQRTWSDACTWTWRVRGELRGVISGHVDDFLFAGGSQDKEWQEILRKIRERFQWGDWEQDNFIQCGVKVEKVPGGYALSQPQFVEGLREIPLNASRKRERKAGTSEKEKSQLRALLGSVSWLAQQTAPHWSAEVSLLLSEVSTSSVETVIKANQLVHNVKQRKQHQMLIHGFSAEEELAMFAWVDAANANRPDGGSTQGIFVGLGPKSMLKGAVGCVSPIAWHSSKLDRVCRSPGAAEALAAVNGEDALYYARFQWSELQHGVTDIRDSRQVVSATVGCLVTDSRNVYDKLKNEVIVVKGAERRTDLELLGLKESQDSTGLLIRWVHSEAQLSNSLTKASGGRELELYYQMRHRWRIVEDEQMRSARKRRQDGLPPLDVVVEEEKEK